MRRCSTILFLCALGLWQMPVVSSTEAAESCLRVATFRCDITPPLGHLLYAKALKTIEHPLEAKGIVLDDGRCRYVLCALDWCTVSNGTHLMFRRKAAAAAGTDVKNVCVQCVHLHTAMSVDGDAVALLSKQPDPPELKHDLAFLDEVGDRIAGAIKESLAAFEPFDSVGTGQAKVDRVASSRRLPIAGGKVRTRFSSTNNPELQAAPEGYIDPYLKTITLARGDRPLVRLHYYATHPQSWYRDGRASIDFVGMAREAIEKEEGAFQLYFTGCAGDVAAGKYNDGTPEARAGLHERLKSAMEASIDSTEMAPAKEIAWRCVPLTLPIRTDKGYTLEEHHARMADKKQSASRRMLAARRIAYASRLDRPIDVAILKIGKVNMLHLPGEPFVDFQLYAQKLLPEQFVAVAGYGDGGPGYICTEASFAEGGYEPTASAVAPESEKIFRRAIRQALGVE